MDSQQHQSYIGDILREMRKEQGQSLRQVSLKTKINPKIIKALEDKELKELPNKVYVLGFIRTYAKALGFDSEMAVKMMEQELGIKADQSQRMSADNALEKTERNSSSMMGIAIISLLVVGLVALLFRNFRSQPTDSVVTGEEVAKKEDSYYTASLNNETPLIIEEAKDLALKEVETEKAPEKTAESTTPVTTETKTDSTAEAAKKAEEEKKEEKVTETEKNTEKNTEKDKDKEKDETDANAEKYKFAKFQGELFTYNTETAVTEEILPEQFKNAVASGMQNVFINASGGDSWITYKKDDEEIKQFVLRQGKKLLIKGKDIRLFLGNTGAIHIFYKNKLLNLNAKSGVKSLVFPPENAKKYSIPLFVHKNPGEVITSDEYQASLDQSQKP